MPAFVAIAHGQAERAAALLGAVEALREKINIPMSNLERIEYDKQVAGLRSGMNEKAFSNLWAEGRSMTVEQAIALALKEEK